MRLRMFGPNIGERLFYVSLGCGIAYMSLLGLYHLLGLGGISRIAFFDNPDSSPGQRELVRLYSEVELGMTRADVYRVFCEKCDTHCLRVDAGESRVIFRAQPTALSGRSWILGVSLENEVVVGLRVRRMDNAHWQPKTAPPDKVSPNSAPVDGWRIGAVDQPS